MRNELLLLLGIGASVLAAERPHLATRDEVLALANHESLQRCSEASFRCTYSISPGDEGWYVFVVEVITEPDGKQSYPVGGHWGYVYSVEGQLLREMPGL